MHIDPHRSRHIDPYRRCHRWPSSAAREWPVDPSRVPKATPAPHSPSPLLHTHIQAPPPRPLLLRRGLPQGAADIRGRGRRRKPGRHRGTLHRAGNGRQRHHREHGDAWLPTGNRPCSDHGVTLPLGVGQWDAGGWAGAQGTDPAVTTRLPSPLVWGNGTQVLSCGG